MKSEQTREFFTQPVENNWSSTTGFRPVLIRLFISRKSFKRIKQSRIHLFWNECSRKSLWHNPTKGLSCDVRADLICHCVVIWSLQHLSSGDWWICLKIAECFHISQPRAVTFCHIIIMIIRDCECYTSIEGFFFVWLQKYKYRITQSMDNRDNNNEFEQDPRPVVLIILPCNKGLESSYIMGHVKLLTVNCIE